MNQKEFFMKAALQQAQKAAGQGEVPVGAVVVKDGQIIAKGCNRREKEKQITGHAEIIALQKAADALGDWRLSGCDLYVTLEPCAMCAGAILQSRIRRVFYGAFDPAEGAVCSKQRMFDLDFAHRPDYEAGVLAEESARLLRAFFEEKRNQPEG